MKNPVYKNPIFWIVAAVTVIALDMAQVASGLSWMHARRVATQGATKAMELAMIDAMEVATYKPKQGEWQLPRGNPALLDTTPPQVAVLPTKFKSSARGAVPGMPMQGGWSYTRSNMAVGTRMSPRTILEIAYDWRTNANRISWPGQMPTNQYDFIANLPTGALVALQKEIGKKLGLTAKAETRQQDVFVLKLNHSDAPGLKQGTQMPKTRRGVTPMARFSSVATLARYLETRLGLPVLDQTGLSGMLTIELPTINMNDPNQLAHYKKVLMDELGLELVQTKAPVEWLVVKKTK